MLVLVQALVFGACVGLGQLHGVEVDCRFNAPVIVLDPPPQPAPLPTLRPARPAHDEPCDANRLP